MRPKGGQSHTLDPNTFPKPDLLSWATQTSAND